MVTTAALSAGFAARDAETIRAVYRSYGALVYSVSYTVLGTPVLPRTPRSRSSCRPGRPPTPSTPIACSGRGSAQSRDGWRSMCTGGSDVIEATQKLTHPIPRWPQIPHLPIRSPTAGKFVRRWTCYRTTIAN